jgi:uncharacterized protein YejL (UPF0352 family)
MKIWMVAKLESVLDRCQDPMNLELSRTGPMATAPQTLSHLLQSEHLHAMKSVLAFTISPRTPTSFTLRIYPLPTMIDSCSAIEWKMKIWMVAKLESVLDRCQAPMNLELSRTGPMATAPQTLSHLLQSEHLHAMKSVLAFTISPRTPLHSH